DPVPAPPSDPTSPVDLGDPALDDDVRSRRCIAPDGLGVQPVGAQLLHNLLRRLLAERADRVAEALDACPGHVELADLDVRGHGKLRTRWPLRGAAGETEKSHHHGNSIPTHGASRRW